MKILNYSCNLLLIITYNEQYVLYTNIYYISYLHSQISFFNLLLAQADKSVFWYLVSDNDCA